MVSLFKKNSTSHTIILANFNEILHTEFQDFNHIHTDASKSSIRVGFAYCISHISKLFKLLPEGNSFTAETQAINKALILTKTTLANKISIISYSLNALLAIEAPNSSNEIVYQIYKIITSTKKSIRIHVDSLTYGNPGKWKSGHTSKRSNHLNLIFIHYYTLILRHKKKYIYTLPIFEKHSGMQYQSQIN